MSGVVVRDLRDYGKKHWRLLAASMAAMLICYGFLVFCGNIRIDTEELINNPGSNLGWLVIGRWGLVLFKKMLGLTVHNTVASGVLFFLFFWLGANLLTFAMYHFAREKERYNYWIFMLLYATSNIWCYQIYFSLQQAEVALAMLLLVIAAFLAMKACFAPVLPEDGAKQAGGRHGKSVWRNGLKIVLSAVLLFLGLGAYQALATYYIAICLCLFLVMLPERGGAAADVDGKLPADGDEKILTNDGKMLLANDGKIITANDGVEVQAEKSRGIWRGILFLMVHFGVVYAAYRAYVKYFMVSSDYMESQMGWGRLAFLDCVKNILRTAKNVLIGYGPRNFSFYGCGVLLLIVALLVLWKGRREDGEERYRRGKRHGGERLLLCLGIAGILAAPFLMTIYMGEMLVTRSQFALPVAAAFLGMYGVGVLENAQKKSGAKKSGGETRDAGTDDAGIYAAKQSGGRMPGRLLLVGKLCVVITIVLQMGYDLRLTYTDTVRFREDAAVTEALLEELQSACGGKLPGQSVIFVGYRKPELGEICRRTEMYGWSFYEWDYSADNPTGATHRIAGFVKAYTGRTLDEGATEEQRQAAVELAQTMPDFPADGSVRVTDDFVVVRLSQVAERTDLDWW